MGNMTAANLDAMPSSTEVRDGDGDRWFKQSDGTWDCEVSPDINGYYRGWDSERLADLEVPMPEENMPGPRFEMGKTLDATVMIQDATKSNVKQGQTWLRKGGTNYNDDQIEVTGPMNASGEFPLVYGDGTHATLDAAYIEREFDLKTTPAGVWVLFDGPSKESVHYIYAEDQEIEALRKMNEQGFGMVEFVEFGQGL